MAAGYTTLVCYILYALFHYCAMRKVCERELDGVYPYNTKILLGITTGFLALGFTFLLMYNSLLLRYIFILVGILIVIYKRKEIKNILNMLLSTKK